MIQGVKVKKLRFIPDERGRLLEIFRCDDETFHAFGQVYCTTCYPGVVKAWHAHQHQEDNIAVLSGMGKIVLCDLREESLTKGEIQEFFCGDYNPLLIHIPTLVYHGFKGIGETETIFLNVPSVPYHHSNPDELRLPFDTSLIAYDWERKNF